MGAGKRVRPEETEKVLLTVKGEGEGRIGERVQGGSKVERNWIRRNHLICAVVFQVPTQGKEEMSLRQLTCQS